ncbi:MAG: FKBP-type peptidyl-prolyl cis-trans isomerase [Bacteroidetes bacterium]|nr:FKBP-type peptidyl-prolyl cis-trans isomerase [Bacteroidota bacterium]
MYNTAASTLSILTVCLYVAGCNTSEQKIVTADTTEAIIKEHLIKANKELTLEEQLTIEAYIKRNGLEMESTSSGLRYRIIQQGTGDSINLGDKVTIAYRVYLLDGTLCYQTDSGQTLLVTVGQFDIPAGMHQALLSMQLGDKWQLLIPSHLAYGLTGDNNKIPMSSTLNVYIETINKSK